MKHAICDPALTGAQRAMLAGRHGDGAALAMRVVVRLARALGADRLIPVDSAHVDGCLFHGQVGIDLVERLISGGARVAVPTTLNVGSLDLLHPGVVRGDAGERADARRLMDGYVALGAEPTWTCAPYQLPKRPAYGRHVAWAESNAIVFANSVLGARTDRYGDFADICAAVTGFAPRVGLHLDENRAGQDLFDCSGVPAGTFEADVAWAALGHLVGRRSGTRVPVLAGLPGDADEDRLKALGAAAASAGGVALFHAVGLTPEAPDTATAFRGRAAGRRFEVTAADLRAACDELTTAPDGRLDAISVGTPHFSAAEFRALAALLAGGPPFDAGIEFWISTSRAVLADAERTGDAAVCRRAGARILVDTCTYIAPVLRASARVVMTNSAKWAWYAPTNLGIDVVFASLAECVLSARAGRVVRDPALWAAP
ncbi:aconitase X [Actinomadura mexicana]|uniref:Predicted aconitase subunit 1 n=1 Tax=Actinomadura mexicana TaxID=134959 RepID=A0A239A2I3_9ACTN|nr:aconitase X catalytic domain-containing protein [Actinomadura mexicana]SNR89214.1 predicted aconitase subunit 1 [Actinomadura mexicana]